MSPRRTPHNRRRAGRCFKASSRFPSAGNVVGRWLQLSLWGTVAFCISGITAGSLEGFAAIAGVYLLLLAISFALAWLGLAFACGLAILCDTAAGSDHVYEWPDPWMYLDWLGDVFFIVNSAAFILAAVAGVAWLLVSGGCSISATAWGGAAATLALFPFVLLSMLEQGSRVVPFSPLVFRSLGRHWQAWTAFCGRARPSLSSPSRRSPASARRASPPWAPAVSDDPLRGADDLLSPARPIGRCCSEREGGHARG